MEINIIHLFPDLLNLYGDRGNIMVLKKRCELRGITPNIIEFRINDEIDISNADIIFLGGGSDREQKLVCHKLLSIKEKLINFRDDLGVILAVCGGYQLLGHYYSLDNEKIEGLSLCDMYTVQKEGRLIGNISIDTPFETVVGFENHGGRTYLGENVAPLGKVISGYGNNGEDGFEGVLYKNIFGTYLHGPLLPKNPEFADLLLERALVRKYKMAELSPIPCEIEKLAKGYILNYDNRINKR